jgi:hypothetical protein
MSVFLLHLANRGVAPATIRPRLTSRFEPTPMELPGDAGLFAPGTEAPHRTIVPEAAHPPVEAPSQPIGVPSDPVDRPGRWQRLATQAGEVGGRTPPHALRGAREAALRSARKGVTDERETSLTPVAVRPERARLAPSFLDTEDAAPTTDHPAGEPLAGPPERVVHGPAGMGDRPVESGVFDESAERTDLPTSARNSVETQASRASPAVGALWAGGDLARDQPVIQIESTRPPGRSPWDESPPPWARAMAVGSVDRRERDLVVHHSAEQPGILRTDRISPIVVRSAPSGPTSFDPHRAENGYRASADNGPGSHPNVSVTIGRIEVRAVAPPSPPAPVRRLTGSGVSLEDYLRARSGNGR